MSQIDKTTKITLDDGTEVSIADLVQNRKDLEEALKINDTLQEDLKEVGHLFQSGSTLEQRETAIRHVLENLGYEDGQIVSYLEQTRSQLQQAELPAQEPDEDEDEVEEIELPDLPDEDDDIEDEAPETSGGSKERTMSDEQERVLRQELEAQRAELHKMRVRELRERLDSELNRVIERNPEIQKLLTASRSLRGDDGVEQAKSTLRAQLERGALERMQARRATAGTFEDAWMSEEVDKAAEPVLGTFRSVIGDIDKLGRSSETVTGLDAEEILRSKPVPEPEYKEGATISDIESQVKSFASDTIKRALASSPGESVV
jgi:small-conductance mechanosensitive channel